MQTLFEGQAQERRFYLVLTAANEIYDDFGEGFSVDKMSDVANGSRFAQVREYSDGQTEEDAIVVFRSTPESRYTELATVVNLKQEPSNSVTNEYRFFVSSFKTFKVDEAEKEADKSHGKNNNCVFL